MITGDIAFTAYRSDNPDEFAFVLLKDLASGASINFTDNGWFAAGGFRANEGTITWQATSNLTAGTEVVITNQVASVGTMTATSGLFSLAAGGDQIFAYQGAAPVTGLETSFLAAINMDGAWASDATSSNNSARPAIFIDGVNSNFISPEIDNAYYDCSTTTGDANTIRSAVNNSANWTTQNTVTGWPTSLVCGFNIVAPSGLTPILVSGVGPGNTYPVGTTTDVWAVIDASGNGDTCSVNVTVVDAEAPALACPNDIVVDNDPGVCAADVNYPAPSATDNCPVTPVPVSTLSAGDIAFTSMIADNPDEWSFVTLTAIAAGTQINFTDNGWFAAGGFRANEGTLTWTTTSILPAGTEVIVTNNNSATVGFVNAVGNNISLASSGDQILAYQGSAANPTFHCRYPLQWINLGKRCYQLQHFCICLTGLD